MANWYVNNSGATNGFGAVGVDTNPGSLASPFLTIDKACKTAAGGDFIYVNSGGGSYSENSGSNYLNLPVALTIQTYSTALTNTGKATVTATATQIINLAVSGCSLINLIVDGGSHGIPGVQVPVGASTTVLQFIDFKNVTGGQNCIRCGGTGQYLVNVDRCTATVANGNASSAALLRVTAPNAASIVNCQGCTANGIGSLVNVTGAAVSGSQINLTYGQDGTTRGTVTNCTNGVLDNAVSPTYALSIQHTDFSGCTIAIQTSTTGTYTSFTVSDCTCVCTVVTQRFILIQGATTTASIQNNTQTGTAGGNFLLSQHTGVNNLTVQNNTYNCTGGGTNDPVQILVCGSGLVFQNNTFTSDSLNHVVSIGVDGFSQLVSNVTTSTGFQNLGDVAGDTYIGQQFTYTPARFTAQGNTLALINIDAKLNGAPAQNVTCYLYSDSSGSPGALLATSDYTFPATGLTAGVQDISFWFSTTRVALVNATNYWIVLKASSISAANYVLLDKGTTTVAMKTSSDGSTWSAGAGSLRYVIGTANYEVLTPLVTANTITGTAASIVHALLVGGCDGCTVTKNVISSTGFGIVSKVNAGDVHTCLFALNVINISGVNSNLNAGLISKASLGCLYYNNTVILTGASTQCAFVLNSNPDAMLGTAYNGVPDRNSVVKKNIFASIGAAASLVVRAGYNNSLDYNVTGAVVDYNVYFMGPNLTNFGGSNLGQLNVSTTAATFAAFKTNTGFDAHSVLGDPQFFNDINPFNGFEYALASVSGGITLAADLTGTVPTDFFGVNFGATGSAGAVQYTGGRQLAAAGAGG